ncbi:hypothetical protein [Streptomyces cirratus]
MLLGAMLHGADRVRQGFTPTDLERPLVDALRTVVSENEMKQWGRTYRDLVAGQGRLAMIPERITSRSASQGYSMTDLRRDLPGMTTEALASPNVQIVDPLTLAAGKPEDPAFIAAMRDTGMAVTAFARPPKASGAAAADEGSAQGDDRPAGQDTEGAGAAAAGFRVVLKLESFDVVRPVGDAGGGRDEIYWAASTSAGGGSGSSYTSDVFGAATAKDNPHVFTEGKNTLFQGNSTGFLATGIQVWEADQSSDEWWNALKKALNTAVDLIDEKLQFMDAVEMGLPTWAGMAWEVGKIFVSIIDAFRNYDDLSCFRTIGLDQQDLAIIAHRGHVSWHFNGDGYHALKVKYAGDPVPFPEGTLEYIAFDGDTASAPLALPWKSGSAPALASFKGKLHALFMRASDQAIMWTVLDGQTWSPPVRVHGWRSYYAPAMAVYRGKLYCALVAANDESSMVWSVNPEGTAWSQTTRSRNTELTTAPALAAWRDQLWMVHVGRDGRMWENYYDESNPTWSPSRNHHPWRTNRPVGLTTQGNTLWHVVRGEGGDKQNRVDVTYCNHTGGWKDLPFPSNWRIGSGATLAAHNSKLWIFFRSTTGVLLSSFHSGASWSDYQAVGAGAEIKPMDESAATLHNGKLYLMYRR